MKLSIHRNKHLSLEPAHLARDLSNAFDWGMGTAMLALLRGEMPKNAPPCLYFLKNKAKEAIVRFGQAAIASQIPVEEAALRILIPQDALALWLEEMPPIYGDEYLTVSDLHSWLEDLKAQVLKELHIYQQHTDVWLESLGSAWKQLGRICFHLAENGENAEGTHPFAFLATFVHQISASNQAKHLPLALALQVYADDHAALLALLKPLQRLAEHSPFLADLISSKQIYQPMAWTAQQAYQFLQLVPQIEEMGICIRIVNLWKTAPAKLQVQVNLEQNAASSKGSSVNIHSLLHFSPFLALGHKRLSQEEIEEILQSEGGIIRFHGEWVSVDKEKIVKLLEQWKNATRMLRQNGIPLIQGLRLLVGGRSMALPSIPPADPDYKITLEDKLSEALSLLHSAPINLPKQFKNILRPYQREGVHFLYNTTNCGFGACLADDMGLGKTLQSIAWLALLAQEGELNSAALIVAPASLLKNWEEEIQRFAPELRSLILHPSVLSNSATAQLRQQPDTLFAQYHIAITTYGMVNQLVDILSPLNFPAIILDEAQAIKNSGSQRSQSISQLQSPRKVALSGTPIENSLMELRSLMEFLNPGLLGSKQEFRDLLISMGTNYAPLRKLIRPFILRRMKSDPHIAPELPAKTEIPCYCELSPEQVRLYQSQVELLQSLIHEPDPNQRLTLILPILTRLKQICNHPAQFLGTDYYAPEASGKFVRLQKLAQQIAENEEKLILFSQYRQPLDPLHDLLATCFKQQGLILNGSTSIQERARIVQQFQSPDGPPFIVLSLKAAGTGLTLTQAQHVIHFDRWWNPAVENQATDRAYRIGQTKPVWVHPLICQGTIEENIHRILSNKQELADSMLAVGLEKFILQLSPEELLALVAN